VGELRGSDRSAVRDQLGREPTTPFTVVARCAPGHPLVIRNEPFDPEGRPFPTLFWLTCPEAVRAVSRVEAEGAIARHNERIEADAAFAGEVARAHADYARERARGRDEAEAHGGVGGTRIGVKCLHAHYANHLAGGEDPVGAWTAGRVEPIHDERPGRFAVVDQGTNSIRLLVVEPGPGGDLRELARDMVITRLGQGVDRTGRIAPDALDRTVGVLARYARRARALHADRIRVAATAAVRDATNREELERAVRLHARSELDVISGRDEGGLTFLGATGGLEASAPFLVLDIGGGSTELVVGGDRPDHVVSIQMGSVRLTERFVRHDPPEPGELDAMRAFVEERLGEAAEAVPVGDAATLVAVAGTSTTVRALSLGLPVYDPERIHRTWLDVGEAERVLDELAAMTTSERAALPVMAPGRADVIVAGALILVAVMRRFGFEEALVSETDILDGLAIDMLRRGAPSSGGPDASL
jgi:exopolyphosphatase/guanosine-5'-triphosphate,3'-diphosphate pyrophosphatase